ncbi:MAG: hypothetical protein HY862_14420 [Chloroflexi bacterium]|nr:hypothetical protein [Chloroflexota bacterium]
MSAEVTSFDIYGFDATRLDIPALLAAIAQAQVGQEPHQPDGWTIAPAHRTTHSTVYRADPTDPAQFPVLSIKLYHRHDRPRATREQAVMGALQDFGVGIGPRPFYASETPEGLNDPVLIAEWIHGTPLKNPPLIDDEEMWHRIMTALGIIKHLQFALCANSIPMMGSGAQQPSDALATLNTELATLSPNHRFYENLSGLVDRAHTTISPEWAKLPRIGLNRFDLEMNHFIWDGHHLRTLGFENTDWADTAYDIGQFCAHPLYEEVPPSHWVWFRWEFARLFHEEEIVFRSTTYTQIAYLMWAIRLTKKADEITDPAQQNRLFAQRDRYLKKAQKAFAG